jgi:hypothetical protein
MVSEILIKTVFNNAGEWFSASDSGYRERPVIFMGAKIEVSLGFF